MAERLTARVFAALYPPVTRPAYPAQRRPDSWLAAARDMKVLQTSIFNAEDSLEQGLVKLRIRMIEAYSRFKARGPVYLLETK